MTSPSKEEWTSMLIGGTIVFLISVVYFVPAAKEEGIKLGKNSGTVVQGSALCVKYGGFSVLGFSTSSNGKDLVKCSNDRWYEIVSSTQLEKSN